jgi:hypothetical protein
MRFCIIVFPWVDRSSLRTPATDANATPSFVERTIDPSVEAAVERSRDEERECRALSSFIE